MEFYEPRDSVYDEYEEPLDPWQTNTPIQSFFAGKHVFITGSTGLIGSLVLENILRTCPKVEKIYLLMRSKRGKSLSERLDSVFECEAFCKVRKIHRNPKEKVQIINGDIVQPMCGISETDKQLLIDNVNVVFHVAAGLRMDETMKNAYSMNVRATKDLLEIATQMKNLQAFVHISTAYSTPFLHVVDEKVYQSEYNADDLKLISTLKETELAALTPKLVGRYKNTYGFTKAVAENVVNEYASKIPVAVVRPSIVIGCEKEPLVNWINNVYGATGVSLAASIGLMRVWYGDNDKLADIIPADKVVTATVAVAWQIGRNRLQERKQAVPVYNIVTSEKSPQTWRDYNFYTEFYGRVFQVISKRFVRTFDFYIENHFWIFKIKAIIYHLFFGILVDQVLKLKGKEPMMTKGFIKIQKFNLQLSSYCASEWRYNQPNTDALWSEMSPLDKKFFNFDMTNFDWKEYHTHTVSSIIVYILKEDLSTLPKDRERYFYLVKILLGVKIVSGTILAYFMRNYFYDLIAFINNIVL